MASCGTDFLLRKKGSKSSVVPWCVIRSESSDTPSLSCLLFKFWFVAFCHEFEKVNRIQTMSERNQAKKHGDICEEEASSKASLFETPVLLEAGAPSREGAFGGMELTDGGVLVGDGGCSLEMERLTRSGSEQDDFASNVLERTIVNVDVEAGDAPSPSAAGAGGGAHQSDGEALSVDAIIREIARLQGMLRLRMESKRPSPTQLLDEEVQDSDGIGIVGSTLEAANEDSWERSPTLVRSERRHVASKPGAVRVFPGETRPLNDEDDSASLDSQPPAPPGVARPQVASTARSDEDILLEADLVADQDEQSETSVSVALLVEAKLIRRKRQALLVASLVCLSSLIAAIAVGVPLFLRAQNDAQQERSAPGLFVEGASVVSLQGEFNETLANSTLANSTLPKINLTTSPQAKAYAWLFGGGDTYRLPRDEAMVRMAHMFALATLYFSTGGNTTWKIKAGWLDKDLHECYWHGVNCANVSAVSYCKDQQGIQRTLNVTEVEGIDLSGNGLSGSLPDELMLLVTAKMRSMELQSNNIAGPIPSGLGHFSTLRVLSLSQNALTGTLPPSLSSLRHLETLQLFQNKISGNMSEIASLTSLREFDARQNQLTGTIPREVYQLTNLTLLGLDGNQLNGTLSKNVGQLTKLVQLNIGGLTGTLPTELGLLTGLTQLYVVSPTFSGPRLSGPIPSEIGNLSQLTNLILSGYLFSGTIPTELSKLTLLDWLYLQRNELRGSIPTELGLLTKLGELDVSENTALTGSVPESLCAMIRNISLVVKVSCDVVPCSESCGCTCV
jgi:Leucine-rich repeat (LRR) protein